ncbi:hypothetical protein G6F57_021045 [Rhizopus arrhizus]|nr:hypothetical protein G6F57_021045 [Rhizopus arrhizus]
MGQDPVGLGDAFDQDLDLAAGDLVARQAGLDDAGVIEDKQVARAQQAGQIGELPVVQLAGAVQVQQAAARAFGGRRLRDEFGRQLVIEIGNGQGLGHAGICLSEGGRPGKNRGPRRPGRLGATRYCKGDS